MDIGEDQQFQPKHGIANPPVILGEVPMGGYDNELSKIVEQLNRAAPSQKSAPHTPASAARVTADLSSLDRLLAAAVSRNASDIIAIAGAPAVLRINGALSAV